MLLKVIAVLLTAGSLLAGVSFMLAVAHARKEQKDWPSSIGQGIGLAIGVFVFVLLFIFVALILVGMYENWLQVLTSLIELAG